MEMTATIAIASTMAIVRLVIDLSDGRGCTVILLVSTCNCYRMMV
jgi:hypothetical protein